MPTHVVHDVLLISGYTDLCYRLHRETMDAWRICSYAIENAGLLTIRTYGQISFAFSRIPVDHLIASPTPCVRAYRCSLVLPLTQQIPFTQLKYSHIYIYIYMSMESPRLVRDNRAILDTCTPLSVDGRTSVAMKNADGMAGLPCENVTDPVGVREPCPGLGCSPTGGEIAQRSLQPCSRLCVRGGEIGKILITKKIADVQEVYCRNAFHRFCHVWSTSIFNARWVGVRR